MPTIDSQTRRIVNLMKDVNKSIAENESTIKKEQLNQIESSQRNIEVVKNLMMKKEDDYFHRRPSSITENQEIDNSSRTQPVRMHSHRGRGIDTETK